MPETPDFEQVREVAISALRPLWPIHGQRNNERVKVGNTVEVDGDQWLVTAVRVSTAIIERQPPEKAQAKKAKS